MPPFLPTHKNPTQGQTHENPNAQGRHGGCCCSLAASERMFLAVINDKKGYDGYGTQTNIIQFDFQLSI
jgi:hypothetical protein